MSDRMPKRNRESSPNHSSEDAPPTESFLEGLDIDDELKESIRALSPTSQREVLNDIVRQQQLAPVQSLLAGTDAEQRANGSGEEEEEEDEGDLWNSAMGGFWFGSGEAGQPHAMLPFRLDRDDRVGGRVGGLHEMLLQHLRTVMGELQHLAALQRLGVNRDIDDLSYEELLALEERVGSVSKGLDSEAKMEECLVHLPEPPAEGSCPICLDEFTPGSALTTPAKATTGGSANDSTGESVEVRSRSSSVTEVRRCVSLKNCGHHFHETCIKAWMRSDKTCPICKQEVIPQTGN